MDDKQRDTGFFHALLEACVDAVIVSDAEGVIQRTNAAAADLFGYERAEMEGRNVSMLMPSETAGLHDGHMSRYIQTGEARIIGTGRDVIGLRKDQSVFPLHLSIGRAEVEGRLYFVALLHDLTKENAALKALERSERLDALGQMTGGIAHDFNNLLTVIIGNLELLEMRGGDEKHQSLIQAALDSAELGAGLIRQLMTFARKGHLRPVDADLGKLCKTILAILKSTIGENYSVSTSIAPALDKVLVDPVQLQMALINLALNARDAMPDGGKMLISVENVRIDDRYMAQETHVSPGDYVRISVSDDGEGMPLDIQQRAFEPFFTTKLDKGGSGLGLAMVYGFVRQSGGHVSLYSEPGHGTTLSLYFPVARGSVSRHAPSNPQADTSVQRGNDEMVLVVEDDPLVRSFAVARLRDAGYRTTEAQSGDEAYEMLKSGLQTDAVFSDLVMPGKLNGHDLAACIERDFPAIKVLLTSGYASDLVSGKDLFVKNRKILHKPYRHAELAQRMHDLLTSDSASG